MIAATRDRPVLEVKNLSVGYPVVGLVVQDVALVLPTGGITALLGPSGCGKTSLLRAIAGLERPSSGTIAIGGQIVAGPDRWVPTERRQVGLVFQEGALFPHLSVRDNLLYGVKGSANGEARAYLVSEMVGIDELLDRFPNELSGGQQQRVALARALAPSPRLLLLDEPFAGLDAGLRARVREEVGAVLKEAGVTALLVTHDQEEALSFAEEVLVMSGGRILQQGSPHEVYLAPRTLEVGRFLGSGQVLPCLVSAGRARSQFGEVDCEGEEGSGELFVRPEDFELRDAGDPVGVAGTIAGRSFFGHDGLERVCLEDGAEIQVRVLATALRPLGSSVSVALRRRTYQVFPGPVVDDGERVSGRAARTSESW